MNEQENNNILNPSGTEPQADAPEKAPESGEKLESTAETGAFEAHTADGESSGTKAQAPAAAAEQNGEYSYTRETLPHTPYVDANYRCDCELNTPRSYYTPPQKIEKNKKEKKGVGLMGFIAACMICALLGGLGGGVLVASTLDDSGSPGIYRGDSSLNISSGEQTNKPDISTIATGEKLTGAEIYALGCEQAVGVTTEITYRNYFGMETSTAVSGSGFIVTENGYIVTNYHVIQTAYEGGYDVFVMLYNGESYPAEIVGFEKDNDIAVLKIDVTGLPAATLGNSDNILVGDAAYAIGNPLGELSFSMTSGSVSALDRSIATTDANTRETITNNMFQIDAAVNEGNSGGPVYNDRGEVIGIVTAKYADTGVEGLGFAIPINDVLTLIEDLIEFGYVTGKPSFGITAKTVDNVSASYYDMVAGAEVVSVSPGSCSEDAGIQVGDIITKVNDTKIESTSDLISTKEDYEPGDTVKITVYRAGEYIELTLTFDEDLGISSTVPSPVEESSETKPEKESLPTVPKG